MHGWQDKIQSPRTAVRGLAGYEIARISIPFTRALPTTVVNWMLITPLLLAFMVNSLTTALNGPPVAAMMSKLVSTWVPLMETLKTRCPGVVTQFSEKCSRTRYWALGAKFGMV